MERKGMRLLTIIIMIFMMLSLVLISCSKKEQKVEQQKVEQVEPKKAAKEEWPDKNRKLTYIIPWAAGGGSDQHARTLAPIVEKTLGIQVICINKPGGSGAVGFTELSKSKPDGYTIAQSTSSISTLPALKVILLTYKDFEPIVGMGYDAPAIMVRTDSPWKTIEDFIDYCKANPGKVKMGTAVVGSMWWLSTKAFEQATGVKFNLIPASGGGAESVTALLGGHVDAATAAVVDGGAGEHIKAGKLRMLAVFSPERLGGFEQVPTLKELGKDVVMATFRGVLAPKGTPQDIVEKLHQAFKQAMASSEYQKLVKSTNSVYKYLSPSEYRQWLADEAEAVNKIIGNIDPKELQQK